jgi:hypothetical protein
MSKHYKGKCFCAAVTYEAKGPPVIVAQCHCEQCRRLSVTGHAVGALFLSTAVIIRGDLGEFRYTSDIGSKVTKSFCARCGSPICGTNTRSPDHLTITLGSMNDAHGLEVQVVIFNRDKPLWDQLGADVPLFDIQPDWTPKE